MKLKLEKIGNSHSKLQWVISGFEKDGTPFRFPILSIDSKGISDKIAPVLMETVREIFVTKNSAEEPTLSDLQTEAITASVSLLYVGLLTFESEDLKRISFHSDPSSLSDLAKSHPSQMIVYSEDVQKAICSIVLNALNKSGFAQKRQDCHASRISTALSQVRMTLLIKEISDALSKDFSKKVSLALPPHSPVRMPSEPSALTAAAMITSSRVLKKGAAVMEKTDAISEKAAETQEESLALITQTDAVLADHGVTGGHDSDDSGKSVKIGGTESTSSAPNSLPKRKRTNREISGGPTKSSPEKRTMTAHVMHRAMKESAAALEEGRKLGL